MVGWGLLIPKGWSAIPIGAGLATGLVADIQFSNTVTVGSIFVAALVVVAGGALTLRNNMRTFWHNLAEERGEQVKVLETRLTGADNRIQDLHEQGKAEMMAFAEEQRIIRHELKNELRATQNLLSAEQDKTDLSALIDVLSLQHDEAKGWAEEGLRKQDRLFEMLTSQNGGAK